EVTVVAAGGTFTLDVAVRASSDDAEEDTAAGGAMDLTSPDLELVQEGPKHQVVGVRFTDVQLPDGAVILSAHVQFTADETDGSASSLTIRGEASDSAGAFTAQVGDVSSRPVTSASVGWSAPPWPVVGEAGAAQRTPDLAAIVQEVIDRPGWVTGNPLAIIVTGSGRRTAEAFDGVPSLAPRLHVEYTLGGGPLNE